MNVVNLFEGVMEEDTGLVGGFVLVDLILFTPNKIYINGDDINVNT